MAAGRTLTVSLVANTNSFRRGMMSAVRDAQGFQGKMTALGASMRGMMGPAFAAAAAAAGAFAAKLAIDGVKAAAAEQVALAKLNTALNNVGQGFAMDTVNTFIDNLQRATGVADDELRPAFQRLVTATGDAAQAQSLLTTSLDVAIGSGRSLESVTVAMAKAATGQTSALKRLGVPLSDAAVKSGDLATVTAELNKAFGGQAATAANTYQGRINRIGVAFSELQESLGTGFLDGLERSEEGTRSLTGAIESLEPAMGALGGMVATQVNGLGDLASIMGLLQEKTGGANSGFVTFMKTVNTFNPSPLEWVSRLRGDLEETGVEFVSAAEKHVGYQDAVVRTGRVSRDAVTHVDELGNEVTQSGEDAEDAAEKFDLFAAAIDKTQTVVAFRQSVDEVGKAFKRTNTPVNIFNEKGKENFDLLNDLIVDTAKYAEGQSTLAGRASAASQGLDTLAGALGNTKMDDETRRLLLEPFQALINDLDEAGVDVAALQRRLDGLKSKTITVTVNSAGMSADAWREFKGGTAMGGHVGHFSMGSHLSDSIPAMLSRGEYVVRASSVQKLGLGFMDAVNMGRVPSGSGGSGVTIGTLNVTSAPGERAEDSVPRSLRRLAFVAGLNV